MPEQQERQEEIEFQPWPKTPRYNRPIIVTEKIDGTNGQVYIGENGEFAVGSRKRWVTPENDNFGFASWAYHHADELIEGLGPGRHFGEWWGSGIQRGYGCQYGEKHFSLFNTSRWKHTLGNGLYQDRVIKPSLNPTIQEPLEELPDIEGLYLVPVLAWLLPFNHFHPEDLLHYLEDVGSLASTGFKKPEGIVIYHIAARSAFKVTLDEK